MECEHFQNHLTDYIDRTLSPAEMSRVAEHLYHCGNCSALRDDVQSLLISLKNLPALEVDPALLDRILLRTSGRPRSRTWREFLIQYFWRPILTPQFVVGSGLVALTLVFSFYLMVPRLPAVTSVLSPKELFRYMDRGVQQVYSQGLKAYDKKNELQAQFTFFKNNVFSKLGLMIEELNVPVEGNHNSGQPGQEQEKAPTDKSSVLLFPA